MKRIHNYEDYVNNLVIIIDGRTKWLYYPWGHGHTGTLCEVLYDETLAPRDKYYKLNSSSNDKFYLPDNDSEMKMMMKGLELVMIKNNYDIH